MSRLLLIGATGMVGVKVAALLPAASLTIVARRSVDTALGAAVHVVPTGRWSEVIAAARADVFINCLGTTIKQAGSQAAFRAADHDLVLAAAEAARAAGARHCISVSSVGANAKSANFYLRTKGEVEAALAAIGFDRIDILRPGLLTGERTGPARPGEALAMLAAPLTDRLLHGALRRYRSISADKVAAAIKALAAAGGTATHIHEHDAICALAD
ncbi:MAG: NAD-dependent dehydratase [Sphingopyxis sp.]|nr:NAD-dependent dehydratase [Sphingopyxis sp.]